ADARAATLTVGWRYEPQQCELYLGGTQRSALIGDAVTLHDVAPGTQATVVKPRQTYDSYDATITAMVDLLRTSAATSTAPTSTLRDHFATLAVIETAHLSSRTGAAESPQLLYERHDIRPPA